jgi:hypothetical protein
MESHFITPSAYGPRKLAPHLPAWLFNGSEAHGERFEVGARHASGERGMLA